MNNKTRTELDNQVGAYWEQLTKTAMMTSNPHRNNSRLSKDDAEVLVSDLIIKWLGFTDEKVAEIMSHPECNPLAYLNKCIKEEITLARSNHNYVSKKEIKTTSYDINISNEDGCSTLKDTLRDTSTTYAQPTADIVHDTLKSISKLESKWYLESKMDDKSTRQIAKDSGVSQSRVAISIRNTNDAVKININNSKNNTND